MGVKYFFKYLNEKHKSCIHSLNKKKMKDVCGQQVSTLLLDMNGIFHPAAQYAFQYGNYKPATPISLLGAPSGETPSFTKQRSQMYKRVCDIVNLYVKIVQPTSTLVLAVDGTAPLSKQIQQRQRRFKAGEGDCEFSQSPSPSFSPNCLTPGTKFMDGLTKYIHVYIQKMCSFDPIWRNLKVIFSNEKVAGEGEQKLMTYIRAHLTESYCVVGLDADLIFLALATHVEKFYVLREDIYNRDNDYFLIDIDALRKSFVKELCEAADLSTASSRSLINDFIFMCFAVGNDFIPHVPAIEILENAIDILIHTYKAVVVNVPLTTKSFKFNKKALKKFYTIIASKEEEIFKEKLSHHETYFPDVILQNNVDKEGKINLDKYFNEYYVKNIFKREIVEEDIENLCHEYLKGLHWILLYYNCGVPSWNWRYPYQYAPSARHLMKYIDTFEFTPFEKYVPSMPFVQLMSVLPPSSKDLIPSPLCDVFFCHEKTKVFFPKKIEIDLAGKKQEWEGIVILPTIDPTVMENLFFDYNKEISDADIIRNKSGHSYMYSYSSGVSNKVGRDNNEFVSKTKIEIYDFQDV